MQIKPPPVTEYAQVNENVKNFNLGLQGEPELERILAYFRSWFFVPEADGVGPSKFIGYVGMSVEDYVSRSDLDGKETEPVLARFFEVLEEGSEEYIYVKQKVSDLCSRAGKRISRAARFSAPTGWRVSSQLGDRPSEIESSGANNPAPADEGHGESDAIVEVFLRAFNSLRPSEKASILKRINATRR